MNQQITYDNRAHNCPFYQIPHWLIHGQQFRDLKPEAKLLFGLILDRLDLSGRNEWRDKNNEAYVYYTIENVEEDLSCSHEKAIKLLNSLEEKKLIRRVRQGLGKPNRIYVTYMDPYSYSEIRNPDL